MRGDAAGGVWKRQSGDARAEQRGEEVAVRIGVHIGLRELVAVGDRAFGLARATAAGSSVSGSYGRAMVSVPPTFGAAAAFVAAGCSVDVEVVDVHPPRMGIRISWNSPIIRLIMIVST